MKIFVLVISIFIFSFFSCSSSVNEMVDDYYQNAVYADENYHIDPVYSPGDEYFEEENMLLDGYFARTDVLLQLAAPYKCKEYLWTIRDVDGKVVKFYSHDETTLLEEYDKRELRIYIPNSTLKVAVYYLTLSVVGNDEETYKDTAVLAVFPEENNH